MGLIPVGEGKARGDTPGAAASARVDNVTATNAELARAQVLFGVGGAVLGFLGVALPHPADFQVPQLLAVNCVTLVVAIPLWFLADRVPTMMIRTMPAFGTLLITASVILSNDATSAYALLYSWPALYGFYFLSRWDAVAQIAFAAICYAFAIAVLGTGGGSSADSGSLVHHYVITVGTLIVVGGMLIYLRGRVEKLLQEVIESARTDLLTGYRNNRGIEEVLAAEVERARMNAHRVALLTFTITGLRSSGKRTVSAVDELLKDMARLLDDSTRRIDTVGRTGNAEFVIVLPETDEGTAFLLAEQILARVRRVYREQQAGLKASIGVAVFPKHAAGADSLIRASAAAVEAAQVLGGDRAVVHSDELEHVLAGDPSQGLTERRTHLSTVLSLAEVLDLRDARTASHSLAVAQYSEMLGRELGLPEARIQRLRLAGLLHDIGKVGIPDSILDKPGPLSPAEWDEVRRHPELAARILGARELTDIREWVLARHEQPDGHGYPRGISGDSIPIESRIIAVAESFDAMTSERPYRSAITREEAIAELGRYSGSQFDGAVVDAFVRVLTRAGSGVSQG